MKAFDKNTQTGSNDMQEEKAWMVDAYETLRAIRGGEVDALIVSTSEGDRVFTLTGADQPYRVMVETMNEGALTMASDGTILYCNQRFTDIIKEPLEKVIGSSVFSYISSKDHHKFEALVERSLNENSKIELDLQTAAGKSAPVLISASPLIGKDKPHVVCMVVTDLTDQKTNDRLEEQVEERTAELKNALTEIKDMKDRLEAENIYFQHEIKMRNKHEKIIGQSEGLKYALYRAEQVAPMNTTVLIMGETGTGKELIADAIHNMSPRKDRPMITVNCAALPPNLIESELFGREKGAFTGADARRVGRFELANGSTFCLDEIGELPFEIQVKLLRVIQHNEFERLGSSNTIKVDVRIVATTNRDLEDEVRKGRFRQDLFYRLNVFPITVPPLRQRISDIPLMVESFVERYARKFRKQITSIPKDTLKALQDYSWPGNVRELESIIERAIILCPGPVFKLADKLTTSQISSDMQTLEETERSQIFRVLSETRWRIEGKDGASVILGIHPSTLRARMHKLGIIRPGAQ